MTVLNHLNTVIQGCGYPPLKHSTAYRKIGEGAWHRVYLVYPQKGERRVIRLKKPVAYGQSVPFDAAACRSEYEAIRFYYQQANQGLTGVCPSAYDYYICPKLTGTVESYMGRSLNLAKLSQSQAFACGQAVGQFFRIMHATPPKIRGQGNIVWDGERLRAEDQRPIDEVWQTQQAVYLGQLEMLVRSDYRFKRQVVQQKLRRVLAGRTMGSEPIALVNLDVTPENLMMRRQRFTGVIDPRPYLGNSTHYAAFFLYIYQFLLPLYDTAPRYVRHRFKAHAPILATIAEGYRDSYVSRSDTDLNQQLRMAYYLWVLQATHRHHQVLTRGPTEVDQLRMGGPTVMLTYVQAGLKELETAEVD